MLDKGFLEAERITRLYANTFYGASRFLDRERRRASYAVYALCRQSDESVDAGAAQADCARALDEIAHRIDRAYETPSPAEPLLLAFKETVTRYRIPREHFAALIEGMGMDTRQSRYADFNALYAYCYRAAGVVGLIMLQIFGSKDESAAAESAVAMGVAMQLTNIIRDIREDSLRGRIYIPLDELARFGVNENDITSGRMTEGFKKLIAFQVERARGYYTKAFPGIPLITDRRSRLVARAMGTWYGAILDEIAGQGYDVFSRRARVPALKKIALLPRIFFPL